MHEVTGDIIDFCELIRNILLYALFEYQKNQTKMMTMIEWVILDKHVFARYTWSCTTPTPTPT